MITNINEFDLPCEVKGAVDKINIDEKFDAVVGYKVIGKDADSIRIQITHMVVEEKKRMY